MFKAVHLAIVGAAAMQAFGAQAQSQMPSIRSQGSLSTEQCQQAKTQCGGAPAEAPKRPATHKATHAVMGAAPAVLPQAKAGECYARIQDAPEYKTVTSQVLKRAAESRVDIVPAKYADSDEVSTVREVEIPEVRKTVSKVVVDTPASTHEVPVPAVMKTVKVRKVVEKAREVKVDVPAAYENVSQTTLVRPGGTEWKQVLCETNATPAKLAEIRSALKDKGYATDGSSASLVGALNEFRSANGIAADGYVTVDTLKALGVNEK